MVRRRLIILAAVQIEARAIAAALRLPCPKPGHPVRADDHAPSLELHLVGVRASHLPENLMNPQTCGIVMAGLAGALDPSLAVGDIVIDDCPPGLRLTVPHRFGKIITSDSLVSTAAQKQAMYAETRALAVDMESAIVRDRAASLNVPFVSLRAISDTANEYLDPAVMKMIDGFGQPCWGSIGATLLGRPSLIPYLMQLGAASRIASAQLGAAVADVCRAWTAMELAPVAHE